MSVPELAIICKGQKRLLGCKVDLVIRPEQHNIHVVCEHTHRLSSFFNSAGFTYLEDSKNNFKKNIRKLQ